MCSGELRASPPLACKPPGAKLERPVPSSWVWPSGKRFFHRSFLPVRSAMVSIRSITSAAMRLSVRCKLSVNMACSVAGSDESTVFASMPIETSPFRSTHEADAKYSSSSAAVEGE